MSGARSPLPATVQRHERMTDLLGISDDPAPRKTRRIEWVGERSPFDDDRVLLRWLRGGYTESQKRVLREAAARANTRAPGRHRLLEHAHALALSPVPGLRRTYRWEPGNRFVCDVDLHDADVILGLACGHEFLDLDDPEAVARRAAGEDRPPALVLAGSEMVGPGEAAAGRLVASA